jgi:diaminopimelate decarboxylase
MADYDPKKDALKLLKQAQNLSMNVVGVRLDLGSKQCTTSYFEAIKLGKKIFSEAQCYGFNLKVLDLGDLPSSVDDASFEDVWKHLC